MESATFSAAPFQTGGRIPTGGLSQGAAPAIRTFSSDTDAGSAHVPKSRSFRQLAAALHSVAVKTLRWLLPPDAWRFR
jgi:hypothetical protein